MGDVPLRSRSVRAGRATAANRGRDSRLELTVRSRVHARGLRYFVARRPLPGLRRTADMLFPRARVVVLLDGCYWHGCPEHFQMPTANRAYWGPKIDRNVERDRETDEKLTEAGWRVLRFWEHEDAEDIARRIEEAVRSAVSVSGDRSQGPVA